MKLLSRRNFLILGAFFCFFLLSYSYWIHSIRQANDDFLNGRPEDALTKYKGAQKSFFSTLANTVPIFRLPFRETALKQIQILYLHKEFEEGLELLQSLSSQYPFLDDDSQYHEWYGNVLFRRSIMQEEPSALLDGLYATLREYQKALELDALSWDARYNYELVKFLLTEEQGGNEKLELLIEEVREKIRNKDEAIPLEKWG